jgi:hypothetical protein
MTVTEEEAKTKRCQESYPAAEGLSLGGFIENAPVPMGAASISSSCYARYTAPVNCIGSACMAWRWENKPPNPLTDDMPVSSLPFSVRTDNCLIYAGLATVGELRKCSEANLLGIPNFGRVSLEEVRQVIGGNAVGTGYCGKAGKP